MKSRFLSRCGARRLPTTAAALACLALAAACALPIDDGKTAQTTTPTSPADSAASRAGDASILGGERDIPMAAGAGAPGPIAHAPGGSGTASERGHGSRALVPAGLGNVGSGEFATAAVLSLSPFLDDPPSAPTLAGAASEHAQALLGSTPLDSRRRRILPSTSFDVALGAGADPGSVGSLQLAVGSAGKAPIDLEPGQLAMVMTPDPATGMLFGFGLFGIGLMRRHAVQGA
jgi:hypothetical protein